MLAFNPRLEYFDANYTHSCNVSQATRALPTHTRNLGDEKPDPFPFSATLPRILLQRS